MVAAFLIWDSSLRDAEAEGRANTGVRSQVAVGLAKVVHIARVRGVAAASYTEPPCRAGTGIAGNCFDAVVYSSSGAREQRILNSSG